MTRTSPSGRRIGLALRRRLSASIAEWIRAAAFALSAAAAVTPAAAQESKPSPIAIDSNVAVDQAFNEDGTRTRAGVIVDAFISANIGKGLEFVARPFAQRLATGEWNRQIWLAEVRYERHGRVGVRVDAGLIPSPIGLANLTLRPSLNATIAQPSSLFTPLPAADAGAPRINLLGPVYPYGVNVTVSGSRWDARAAVIDTSPLRTRRVFASTNPPRLGTVVLGGGITPVVGLRLGVSMAHGIWWREGEAGVPGDRESTMATFEAEYAVRYTRLAGEWVRDALQTRAGRQTATGWFVQGQQTISPRWFAAGRVERMSAPAFAAALGVTSTQHLTGTEETVGFRLTPEFTLRASHRARRTFGQADYLHQGTVSIVWWRRWV
jgi:hypothetical protein